MRATCKTEAKAAARRPSHAVVLHGRPCVAPCAPPPAAAKRLRLEVGLPPLVGLGTAQMRRTRLHFKPSARRLCAPLLFFADVRHVAPTDPAIASLKVAI